MSIQIDRAATFRRVAPLPRRYRQIAATASHRIRASRLLPQSELADQLQVARPVLPCEVLEQGGAFADHLEQAAT